MTQAGTFATAGPGAADSAGQVHVAYELTRADWAARHRPVS